MQSIRRAITLPAISTIIIVCAVAFLIIYLISDHIARRQFDQALSARARSIISAVQFEDGKLEIDLPDEGFDEYTKQRSGYYFQIIDQNHQVRLHSKNLNQTPLAESPLTNQRIGLPGTDEIAFGHFPFTVDDEQSGETHAENPGNQSREPQIPVTIIVSASTKEIHRSQMQLAIALIGAFVAIIVPLAFLLPRIVSRGLAPLHKMSQHVASLKPETLNTPFATDSMPSELQPVAVQLNQSLNRLSEAFDRERLFAGNAAHELRTPIAAIRTNAEVALKWPEPDQLKQSMTDILSTTKRIEPLLVRLLELTRTGKSSGRINPQDVDLQLLLTGIIKESSSIAQLRRSTIESQIDPITLSTDPTLLQPLLENIIHNSIKHSPEGSTIHIRLAGNSRSANICIENQAPDLHVADLAKMFAPFWTKNAHRTQLGAGLGLSLAAEYAKTLQAQINASLTDQNVLIMNIILPELSNI